MPEILLQNHWKFKDAEISVIGKYDKVKEELFCLRSFLWQLKLLKSSVCLCSEFFEKSSTISAKLQHHLKQNKVSIK